MRRVLTLAALLLALGLSAHPTAAQAQYCWDTVCAAGTPAADCWRAWCPTTSAPAYTPSLLSPYGSVRYWWLDPAPAPRAPTLGEQWFHELGRNNGCVGFAGLYC